MPNLFSRNRRGPTQADLLSGRAIRYPDGSIRYRDGTRSPSGGRASELTHVRLPPNRSKDRRDFQRSFKTNRDRYAQQFSKDNLVNNFKQNILGKALSLPGKLLGFGDKDYPYTAARVYIKDGKAVVDKKRHGQGGTLHTLDHPKGNEAGYKNALEIGQFAADRINQLIEETGHTPPPGFSLRVGSASGRSNKLGAGFWVGPDGSGSFAKGARFTNLNTPAEFARFLDKQIADGGGFDFEALPNWSDQVLNPPPIGRTYKDPLRDVVGKTAEIASFIPGPHQPIAQGYSATDRFARGDVLGGAIKSLPFLVDKVPLPNISEGPPQTLGFQGGAVSNFGGGAETGRQIKTKPKPALKPPSEPTNISAMADINQTVPAIPIPLPGIELPEFGGGAEPGAPIQARPLPAPASPTGPTDADGWEATTENTFPFPIVLPPIDGGITTDDTSITASGSAGTPVPTGGSAGTPVPTGGSAGTPVPTGGSAGTPVPTGGSAGTPVPTGGSAGGLGTRDYLNLLMLGLPFLLDRNRGGRAADKMAQVQQQALEQAQQNIQSGQTSSIDALREGYRAGRERLFDKAVPTGRGDITTGRDTGLETLAGTEQYIRGDFNPYTEAGALAIREQAALSGLLGREAEQAALDKFIETPGQQWLRERQERGLLRNQAAIGGLGGGNVRTALQQQAADIANTYLQQHRDNLERIVTGGRGATVSQAQALSPVYNRQTDIPVQAGRDLAELELKAGITDAELAGSSAKSIAQVNQQAGENLASLAGQIGRAQAQGISDRAYATTDFQNRLAQAGGQALDILFRDNPQTVAPLPAPFSPAVQETSSSSPVAPVPQTPQQGWPATVPNTFPQSPYTPVPANSIQSDDVNTSSVAPVNSQPLGNSLVAGMAGGQPALNYMAPNNMVPQSGLISPAAPSPVPTVLMAKSKPRMFYAPNYLG